MAIEYRDAGGMVQSGLYPSEFVMPLGSNWAPGDLRIYAMTMSTSRSPNLPAGWAVLANLTGSNGVGSRSLSVIAKELAEGDTDQTITINGSAGPNIGNVGLTLRGADNAKILAPRNPTALGDSSKKSYAAPSWTVPAEDVPGDLINMFWCTRAAGNVDARVGPFNNISGMNNRINLLSDAAKGYNILVATETRTASGATGTRTATSSASDTPDNGTALSLFVPEKIVVGPEPYRMAMAYN